MILTISESFGEMIATAKTRLLRIVRDSILERGRFTIALSGGSTPRALYQDLGATPIGKSKWFFFFGDDRNVMPDDEESNLRMAKEALLDSIPPEERNVFAWATGFGEPEQIADEYGRRVLDFFKQYPDSNDDSMPRFDLVLLGMGSDGHTASLFPNTAALSETERISVANFVPQLNAWRYTMTLPIINNARNIMFLVSGPEKAAMLRDVLEGEFRPDELPAQAVLPTNGELYWFVDKTAAELLAETRV